MNTEDKNRITNRSRNSWEAMDLGNRLISERLGFYMALWFVSSFPIYFIVIVLLWHYPSVGLLIIWWLKPLFEGGILSVLSVQVFGQKPDFWPSVWQTWRLMFRPRIVGDLLWRRFNITRSLLLPLVVLENVKGKAFRERAKQITYKNIRYITWLSHFGAQFEAILLFSFFIIGAWLIFGNPLHSALSGGGVNFFIFRVKKFLMWYLSQEEDWLFNLVNFVYMLCIAFWEPFFVANGFTFYLHARTRTEAWDIRLVFLNKQSGRTTISGLLILLVSAILIMGVLSRPAYAEVPPDKAVVLQDRADTVEKAPFYHLEPKKIKTSKSESEKEVRFMFFSKSHPISLLTKFIYIVVILSTIFICLIALRFWLDKTSITWWSKNKKGAVITQLFGLNVEADKLPENLTQTALGIFDNNPRMALQLLYRGLLVQLLNIGELPVKSSDTELEVLTQVSQYCPKFYDTSRQITLTWVQLAYAHNKLDRETFIHLCHLYDNTFSSASLGGQS